MNFEEKSRERFYSDCNTLVWYNIIFDKMKEKQSLFNGKIPLIILILWNILKRKTYDCVGIISC